MSEFVHSSESNEHYTPPEIVEASRKWLGAIDLDPFSCELANTVVKADTFFSEGGFEQPWQVPIFLPNGERKRSKCFVNPPGGKLNKDLEKVNGGPGMSCAALGWCKLVHEWEIGNVHSAIYIGFNLEVLRITQQYEAMGIRSCLTFPFCIPKDRLKFWGANVAPGTGSPQYPNVIVAIPSKAALAEGRGSTANKHFVQLFKPFGAVVVP